MGGAEEQEPLYLHEKVEGVVLCDPCAGGVRYRARMESLILRH